MSVVHATGRSPASVFPVIELGTAGVEHLLMPGRSRYKLPYELGAKWSARGWARNVVGV